MTEQNKVEAEQDDVTLKSVLDSMEPDVGEMTVVKRTFSTGIVKYYAEGRVLIDGQTYQTLIDITLLKSRP